MSTDKLEERLNEDEVLEIRPRQVTVFVEAYGWVKNELKSVYVNKYSVSAQDLKRGTWLEQFPEKLKGLDEKVKPYSFGDLKWKVTVEKVTDEEPIKVYEGEIFGKELVKQLKNIEPTKYVDAGALKIRLEQIRQPYVVNFYVEGDLEQIKNRAGIEEEIQPPVSLGFYDFSQAVRYTVDTLRKIVKAVEQANVSNPNPYGIERFAIKVGDREIVKIENNIGPKELKNKLDEIENKLKKYSGMKKGKIEVTLGIQEGSGYF